MNIGTQYRPNFLWYWVLCRPTGGWPRIVGQNTFLVEHLDVSQRLALRYGSQLWILLLIQLWQFKDRQNVTQLQKLLNDVGTGSTSFQTWYLSIFYTARFLGHKFYIVKVRHLRYFLLTTLQRKCIKHQYFGHFLVTNELNSEISIVLIEKTQKHEWTLNFCANFAREYVAFWRDLHRQQKFYTPAGSDGRDKYYLCLLWSKKCDVSNPGHGLTSIDPKNLTLVTRGPNKPPTNQKAWRW